MNSEPGAALVARIVYLALLASVLLFTAVATLAQVPQAAGLPAGSVYSPFVVGAAVFAGALICRRHISRPARGVTEEEWWRANLSRAILIWGLLEVGALFGAVLFFGSRNYLPLAVTGCGLFLLVLTAPSRLAGG